MMVIAPVRVPVAGGLKVTLMVQPALAGKPVPQLFVSWKSPLGTMLSMVSMAPPVLVRVMFAPGWRCQPSGR